MNEKFGKAVELSLGMCLVYLGSYFSPYMILAFINDPIQTGFVYGMLGSFIISIF